MDSIRRRSFSPDNLDMIENDFRLILSCSNFIGKIDAVENTVVPTSSTRSTCTHIGGRSRPHQGPSHDSPTQSPSSSSSSSSGSCNPSGSTGGIPGSRASSPKNVIF